PRINELTENLTSLRSLYVAILSLFKYDPSLKSILMEEYDKWVEEFEIWNENYKHKVEQNQPSERQRESYLSFEEMREKVKTLPMGSEERMLLAIYTYIPPVRSDYGRLRIYYDRVPRNPESNYLLLSPEDAKIHIGDHKTVSTNGNILQSIPHELFMEITEHLQFHPEKKYLFEGRNGKPFQKNSFVKHTGRKFLEVFKKPVTVNTIRHAFINHLDFNRLSIQEKKTIAERMGHGISTQDKYRLFI
ncbi:MAG TPA: hypothetical protein V6C58_28560, partial [Allocoleopsis sp.]